MTTGGKDGRLELDGGDRELCGDDDGEGEDDISAVIGFDL